MESCAGGGRGGGRRLRLVFPVVLLWMTLHQHVLGCSSTNCNQLLTEAQGEITSPCYPQKYPNSQMCTWTVQAPAGFVIQLTFLDFDLEEAPGCIYDRVVVNTGNAAVTFCGLTANGLTLNSTKNVMELSFTSDFSVQKRGFNVSYRHVALALRNQKVSISSGAGKLTQVANTVTIPTMSQLTVCFEVQRVTQKQKEWLFSYYDSNNNVALALGTDGSGSTLIVDGVSCSINDLVSPADFTAQMKAWCVVWKATGTVAVFDNGTLWPRSCYTSVGHSVPGGGLFRLGGQHSFDGNIYNLRLWDVDMSEEQLKALTCDKAGNVIDWDNSNWTIPATLAQTDSTLSCIASSCDSSGLGCPEALFYRLSFTVDEGSSALTQDDVEQAVTVWLSETFQNWTHRVTVDNISVKPSSASGGNQRSYSCQALLLGFYANQNLGDAVLTRLSSRMGLVGDGLQIHSMALQLIDNCSEESRPHYHWPETSPNITQHLPCSINKDQKASRTCLISPQNYSSYWSPVNLRSCQKIEAIQVSADNAAEVAAQLVDYSKNLTRQEVSKVVTKVKELVNVAKINSTLASSVVNIISNVMASSDPTPAASSEALKTMDDLAQKIEFEGPSLNITSRNLILGVLAFNSSTFNGLSFSAFRLPNSTETQIDFESDRINALAQITLPASLLSSVSLSEAERSSLSRINFMFFNNTSFFLSEQDNRFLNSYVVASSVGNLSIKHLTVPVEIEFAHISKKTSPDPLCVFWDFSMNEGLGGWNNHGCRASENSTSNKTVCLCDHLTHFGILMDISGSYSQIDQRNEMILTFITYVGCGVSTVFLAVTLLTYVAFEKLRRDYPSKILMNLSASLLFLNMVFLMDGWVASLENSPLCQSVAVFLHYFLLTSFTWMGLESLHMYIALVKVFNTYVRRYILKFCIVGWGLPAAMVVIVVSVNKQHYALLEYKDDSTNQSSKFCWIHSAAVLYTTCIGYFCLVFMLNVVMFIVVMRQICGRNGKRSNRTLREEVLRNLRSAVSLTFLLGMTWGLFLFAWGPVHLVFMYLFTIFNSLQGLFIFIFHCALKENVQKQWRRYLCCGRFRLSDNSDWSKTATNNTKKVSSENLGKSLSSSSFGSSTANWTSKAKATLNPFSKRHSSTDKCFSSPTGPKCVSSSSSEVEPSSSSAILPVSQMLDKVKGYCSMRSDNFYKNILMSDSFTQSTRF